MRHLELKIGLSLLRTLQWDRDQYGEQTCAPLVTERAYLYTDYHHYKPRRSDQSKQKGQPTSLFYCYDDLLQCVCTAHLLTINPAKVVFLSIFVTEEE